MADWKLSNSTFLSSCQGCVIDEEVSKFEYEFKTVCILDHVPFGNSATINVFSQFSAGIINAADNLFLNSKRGTLVSVGSFRLDLLPKI